MPSTESYLMLSGTLFAVGLIGVSGGMVDQDVAVAEAAAKAL